MSRVLAALLAALCAAAVLVAPSSASAATDGDITFTGRGWGHGRGMGQYGALGYAVDHGWQSPQILDHFYRGTSAGQVGNVEIGVELLSWRNRPLLVTGRGLAVNGAPVAGAAVQVLQSGAEMLVRTAPSCGGPWTDGPRLPVGVTVTAAGGVELCEVGTTRGYRGSMSLVGRPGGTAVVNRLAVEDYLRGVVPRESPASWASAGGGRGAQALRAQSVAARSYALSSVYASYATTCDTTTCQVYGGAFVRNQGTGAVTWLEDARTDDAIRATAGVVRRHPSGAVARTEFSSSTGGWTAGGTFSAVQDLGDATAANPNRSWSVTLSRARVTELLGVGQVNDLQVSRRNGLGADGGRVLEVVVTTPAGKVALTGATVRSRLGLKSDWFTPSVVVDLRAHEAVVKALWADMLGRQPTAGELAERTAQLAAGRTAHSLSDEVSRSSERAKLVVESTYRSALGRTPSPGEIRGWMALFQGYGSIPQLQSGILASAEAWNVSNRDAGTWVDLMYRVTLGRSASAGERAYWGARIAQSDRYQVAIGIAGSYEAGTIRLDGYYVAMLGRHRDPGSAGWVPFLLLEANGDTFVPGVLGGSAEYVARARQRF